MNPDIFQTRAIAMFNLAMALKETTDRTAANIIIDMMETVRDSVNVIAHDFEYTDVVIPFIDPKPTKGK